MSNIRRKGYSRTKEEEESQSLLEETSFTGLGGTSQLANLHPKKREDASPLRPKLDQTIECEVQPSDSLRTLSLKYNIPVAELKRVNNILADGEFFALKRIKIPVKPNSLLPEMLGKDRDDDRTEGNGWYVDHRDASATSMSSRLSSGVSSPISTPCSEMEGSPHVKTVSIGDTVFSESRDKKKAKKFLKEMDKDLQRIREKQKNMGTVDQIVNGNETRIYPLRASQFQQDNTGCSNRSLACWCSVVTVLIVIVFCVLVTLMSVHHDISKEEIDKWEHGNNRTVHR